MTLEELMAIEAMGFEVPAEEWLKAAGADKEGE